MSHEPRDFLPDHRSEFEDVRKLFSKYSLILDNLGEILHLAQDEVKSFITVSS